MDTKQVLTMVLLAGALLAAVPGISQAQSERGAQWSTHPTGMSEVKVPVNLAYSYPDRDALESDNGRISGWKDARQSLVWYGKLAKSGALYADVPVRLPIGEKVTLRLTVTPGSVENPTTKAAQSFTMTMTGGGKDTPTIFSFHSLKVAPANVGWTRFTLSGVKKSGATFGDVEALTLTGGAVYDAFFNTTHYRSTASVHLGYHPAATAEPIDAFYNEVTARRDPVVTYYCAIGWSRGYMGYQVNGPNERRVIFSVWDAGAEKNDQSAVAAKDRAQWLARGPGVVTDRFGNEGTGGHSHLVYPWKNGKPYRFLVTAQTDGPDHVIYAGYFFFPEKRAWGLIGKIRTPSKKPGDSASEAALHGLYSFDEDFSGAAGDKLRTAEFGPQWAHSSTDGRWHEVLDAHFSNTDRKREQRDDYDARPTASGRAFTLSTGGYVSPNPPVVYGDRLKRMPTGNPPEDFLNLLGNLPTGIPMNDAAQGKK